MLAPVFNTARRYVGQILLDAAVVILSFYLCCSLLYNSEAPRFCAEAFQSYLVAVFIYCLTNYVFALYHRIWRYASAQEVVVVFGATVFSTLVWALANVGSLIHPQLLEAQFLGGFFSFAGFTAVRYRWRLVTGFALRWRALWGRWPVPPANVLIVGAGEAGQHLAWQLRNQNSQKTFNVVGFVDDDAQKQGLWLHGVRILGDRQQIPGIVARKGVDLILLAVDNESDADLQEIVSLCLETQAQIKLLPDPLGVVESGNNALPLKDMTVQDLMGREPASIDFEKCRQILSGKVVLVAGAAGSIGSELCRQLLKFEPRRLIALDNNETGLYDLNLELNANGNSPLQLALADITNAKKMEKVYQQQRPDVVFHAAAYKHVPLLEEHPEEAVQVNVLGTVIISQWAEKYRVERFIYISTDKAVNPTSVMGASKRIGEMWIAALQRDSQTLYTIVRFGNVIGSRGSVIPTFERQIERGGPVTVTHPDMTRFFLSIPEAVCLTIQAASLTQGGEIYMLDMGKEMRILDLAHRMIRFRGLRVNKDIRVEFVGIRPGEKLHEELSYADEEIQPTPHARIFRLQSHNSFDRGALLAQIMVLVEASQSDQRLLTRLPRAIIEASLEDIDSMLDTLANARLSSGCCKVDGDRRLVVLAQPAL